mmetsp:Transcript_1728/g.2625  ORF Transcript_1728/g.2625 Transcript_1728/m.2625 type:complete len:224 (-) Transcript_1728:122-793(-)
MTTIPANITLHYWDFPFWRGECIRMALFYGEVSFHDERHNNPLELHNQGKLSFGDMPILEVDGKILSQTHAIANYVSDLAGIKPQTPWMIAKVDEIICGCQDVTANLHSSMNIIANATDARFLQDFIVKLLDPEDGKMHLLMNGIEKIIQENGTSAHAVGDSMTIADFAIWRLVNSIGRPPFKDIPEQWVSATFPGIVGVVETVETDPKVIEWKSQFDFYQDV